MRSAYSCALAFGVCCCLPAAAAYGHGYVGERAFIEPFVTEDVSPKNEFVVSRPQWLSGAEGRAFSLGVSVEKKLADTVSLGLETDWNSISPEPASEPQATGFGNLGVTLKKAFLVSPPHESILSIALEAEAPTGSNDAGAEPYWVFAPIFLWGQGFGVLPESLRYLRPLALQGDLAFEIGLDGQHTTFFKTDFCFQYNLQYLQEVVRDVGLGWPLNRILAVTEFNLEQGVSGKEAGLGEFVVTPGVVYLSHYIEIGIAGRFPLNAGTGEDLDYGVIGIVDLFYDEIIPALAWQPF